MKRVHPPLIRDSLDHTRVGQPNGCRVLGWLLLLCLALPGRAGAELIPSERLIPWVHSLTVGVPRGIPADRTHLIDVTKPPYRADKTGLTDTRAALIAAIRDAKSNDVIYLPPGRYRLDAPIQQDSKERGLSFYTVRGAGTNTVIDWRGSWGSAFAIGQAGYGLFGGGTTAPEHRIVAGLEKGSTNIVVNGKFDWRAAGPMIRITQRNDADVFSVFGHNYLVGQMVMVMGVKGSEVSIWPPLATTFKTNLLASYGTDWLFMARFVGVEDLVIDATSSWSGMPAVNLGPAYGCWLKNVQVLWAANYGIKIESCVQCTVQGCSMYGSKHRTPGDWSNHAGLLVEETSSCLFENNLIYQFFPGIEITRGSSANVFTYNFLEDNYVDGLMGASVDSNHNPHNRYNLFEGNVASKFQCDAYFGSTSDDILFRNWFHGTCSRTAENGQCINLNRFSYRYSIVGNVLGTSNLVFKYENANGGFAYKDRYIYSLGLPNMGNGGFNGRYGPPWAAAVREGGAVLINQNGNRVTAPSPMFTPDMAGQSLLTDDGVRQEIKGVVNPQTLIVSGEYSRAKQHFAIGPGPNGYQELDTNVLATVIRIGNYNYATASVPASESLGTNTLPKSLFYTATPDWWPSGKPWPAIGPDLNPLVTSIPAQDRFRELNQVMPKSPAAPPPPK